jgi:histone-binding protein RBBP4
MRNLTQRIHALEGHTKDVLSVTWSPLNESLLASCSADRRAILWDLASIGAEQTAEDAEDGPPELLFVHGGHTSNISDLSWNPNCDGVLATTSEDNILQIWQPAGNILHEDEEGIQEVADNELEDDEPAK